MTLQYYEIPTKTHSNSFPAPPATGEFDAFAFYSDDAQRMNTLLLRNEDGEAVRSQSCASARSNPSSPKPTSDRRTRISFEVHPDLLFRDLLYFDDERSSPIELMDEGEDKFLDLLQSQSSQ